MVSAHLTVFLGFLRFVVTSTGCARPDQADPWPLSNGCPTEDSLDDVDDDDDTEEEDEPGSPEVSSR